MGFMSRIKEIMDSNINDFLEGLEAKNAEKMINMKLRELREQLAEAQKETGAVIANESAAKRRLDAALAEVKKYEEGAYKALAAGNEEDARQLLTIKQRKEAPVEGLQRNYDVAHAEAEKARAGYKKLMDDIAMCEARADVIKSKMATAKVRETVNKVSAAASSVGAGMSAFDRFEEQADKRLDTANAMAELNQQASSDEDLLSKYSGGGSGSVDDELAKMKAKLGGQGA